MAFRFLIFVNDPENNEITRIKEQDKYPLDIAKIFDMNFY